MLNLRSSLVVAALAVASPASADTSNETPAEVELANHFADAMSSRSSDVVFHKLIEFAPASARVYSADRELLYRMAKTWIESGQQTVITVHGYSDSLDLGLAERRASNIRRYLIKSGVAPSRVIAVGHTLDKDGRRIDLAIGSCEPGRCGPKHAAK
jgi:outer membrane protein OmpA-like peptidoglycan-associated protein